MPPAVAISRSLLINQRLAGRLGWTPRDVGAVAFDAALDGRIREAQRGLGVEVDGLLGGVTYAAMLARDAAQLRAQLAATPKALEVAGRLAATEAKRLWLRGVVDPSSGAAHHAASRVVIDGLIRSVEGLGWGWEAPYQRDGDFEWCGTLAAWGWRAAGVSLALRQKYFASTYRLDRYGRYGRVDEGTANLRPVDAPRRWLALDERSTAEDAWFDDDDPPRAGDILLVGPVRSDYGKHICVVEAFEVASGTFTTIEGNGTGDLPDGTRAHGIVRNRRVVGLAADAPPTRYHPRRLIRPSVHDLGG